MQKHPARPETPGSRKSITAAVLTGKAPPPLAKGCVPLLLLAGLLGPASLQARDEAKRPNFIIVVAEVSPEVSARQGLPQFLGDDHVGVPPGVLAEELDRPRRVADEGAQDPAHLDAHEGVDDQPGP